MTKTLSEYICDETGAAAAEFAMFVVFLVPLLLNLGDIGAYVFQRLQVENAAQAGAQAAWTNCTVVPYTSTNCPNLTPAVTNAVQGASLGTRVTWSNSGAFSSDAGYYCPDGTNNALVTATSGTKCTSTGGFAGYYVKVSVSYPFHALFAGATIASLFESPIQRTAWARLK